MIRLLIGLVVGLVAGGMAVMLIESISTVLYPMPADPTPGPPTLDDLERMREFVASLPLPAFAIVLLAHGLGSFVAGFTGYAVSRQDRTWIPLVLGGFFMLGGIMMLLTIPHPAWFAIADLVCYLPMALLGHRIAKARFPSPVTGSDLGP